MELLNGIPLFWQQYKALLKKNLLLSWRYRRATSIQLFASLFFIALIFCIEKAIRSRLSNSTNFENVFDPELLVAPSIPPCEDKFYMKLPCFDFAWSGNRSARAQRIVSRIMENNPGRPIPSSKVKSFGNSADVDAWLLNDPMRCSGALHFVDRNATVMSYGIQTNSTPVSMRGKYEDPTFKFQIPLQIAAEREISRSLIGDPSFIWDVGFKEFAHPSIELFSTVGAVGPTFFLATAMFGFVFQISSLVTEKELKFRQAMNIMGLYDSAYWLSWLTWEGIMTLLSSLLTVLFGMMFRFDFFLNNNFVVVLLVFFLFQFNMVAFAFMLSVFVSKSSSSTTMGFSMFIIGFLTQLVTAFGFPYSEEFSDTYRTIWSLFTPNLLAEALKLLADATSTPQDAGISWNRRGECAPNDSECVVTINDIYLWLVGTFFLWLVLALYLDNIIPNSFAVRKPTLYFLMPSYWTGKDTNNVEGGFCSCRSTLPSVEHLIPDDEDVLAEERIVREQAKEGTTSPYEAVQIHGLCKTYPGTKRIGLFKFKRTSTHHAIKGLWVNFAKDQLFCLLGPNGAGKTTVINCLTGIMPVTDGDALVYGNSIRSSAGMSKIRRMIGVCPQFDILWDVLSGQEHLHLFASIKGLPSALTKSVVEKSLEEVRLTEAAKMRTGAYSGGMRRRLSVAISLIGDPKLVILDEPTTGMDPISRRYVWDIIEEAKRGRAIILTTHSMEEADILSDRIGIMAKGRLRCVGTSIRLKSRFGTGFITHVSFSRGSDVSNSLDGSEDAPPDMVKQLFKDRLDILPKEEDKDFLTFVIPHQREATLMDFFEELQNRQVELGISDIQLSLTTLEEVFLNIAKQAELESATAEGIFTTLHLSSGSSLEIPVGARFVGIPGTVSAENPMGVMVEVYWEQDDSGSLCISGHSEETQVPLDARILDTTTTATSRRGQLQYGIVIDLNQADASSL